MNKSLLLIIVLLSFSFHLYSQDSSANIIYIIDSIPVIDQPDESESALDPNFIADMNIIKNKDTLTKLGYGNMDGAIYIFTKEYRNRSEEIKRIPTLRQMTFKNKQWYLNENNTPYTGPVIDYYYNGRKKGECILKEGKAEGVSKRYYQNGNLLLERHYENGIENGTDKEYYSDGSLNQKGEFVNGKEEGRWEFYYPNGQVKIRNNYLDGELVDSATTFYSSGKIKNRVFIKDGKIVSDLSITKMQKLYNKGGDLDKDEDYKASIKEYSKCLEIDSNYIEAYFARGTAELNNFQFDEAIKDLDKAILIEPYYVEALGNRAFCRIRKYQFANSRTLSSNSEITVLATKDDVVIPESEIEKICTDLQETILLGDKSKMIMDAFAKYCEKKKGN